MVVPRNAQSSEARGKRNDCELMEMRTVGMGLE